MFVFFKSSNQFFSSTFFFFLFIKFKGYNAKEAGKRKCEMCLAGTYASMQNTVHCLLCEGGKLSKEASTSCELLCKAGQYKMVIKIDYFDPSSVVVATLDNGTVANMTKSEIEELVRAEKAAAAAAAVAAAAAAAARTGFEDEEAEQVTALQVIKFEMLNSNGNTAWESQVGNESYLVTHNELGPDVPERFSLGDNVTIQGAPLIDVPEVIYNPYLTWSLGHGWSFEDHSNRVWMVHCVVDRWSFVIGNRIFGPYIAPDGISQRWKCADSIPSIVLGSGTTTAMATCEDCPAGRSSADLGGVAIQKRSGLAQCDMCHNGRYSTKGQEICEECWAGFASSRPGAQKQCEKCAGGKYSPSSGYTECTDCEPGLYNCDVWEFDLDPKRCSEFHDKCQMCGAGNATDEQYNATECTPCPAGTYGNDHMDEERLYNSRYATCDPCPINQFSNNTGVDKCVKCPYKTFTRHKEKQSECEGCWRGEIFGNNKTNGENECLGCPSPNSDYPRGTYSFVPGDDRPNCHSCPQGADCGGLDSVTVQWGWWRSVGRKHDIDQNGKPGQCTLNGEVPTQCGDECDSDWNCPFDTSGMQDVNCLEAGFAKNAHCIGMPAGNGTSRTIVHKWRCKQDWMSGRLGEMYDECGTRKHILMCDGDEPGMKCLDFLDRATPDGTGFDFEGEAERKDKVNFDLSSGDFDKMDGSRIYLSDGCNACRLTTLVTNIQMIRIDGATVETPTLAFDVGFLNSSIKVDTNISAESLKLSLERLPDLVEWLKKDDQKRAKERVLQLSNRVEVRKRGTTSHHAITCAQIQETYEIYGAPSCIPFGRFPGFAIEKCAAAVVELRKNCLEKPECHFDEDIASRQMAAINAYLNVEPKAPGDPFPLEGGYADVTNHCKARGDEWLITFRSGRGEQVPILTVHAHTELLAFSYGHENATHNRKANNISDWTDAEGMLTGQSISVTNATTRQVLCNAENGKNLMQANEGVNTCHEFEIFQTGSRVAQQVRYQINWNDTVYSELVIASKDHIDNDAPAHRCNVAAGYSGRMCQVCLQGFGRSGRFGCKRCSADPVTTGLVSLMGLGAAVGYVSLFVYVVIKDAGSTSTAGSVQKILLNHFQLVSLCVNYPLNWPSDLLTMFNYFSFLSDISEKVLDLDCALKDPVIFGWAGLQPFFLLQLFYSVIPVLMIVGFICFWMVKGGILHCCCGGHKKSLMDNTKIVLTEVPEGLKAKYEKRLVHEKLLAKQHMFKYAARMTSIKDAPMKGFKGITDAVGASYHKHEREEAKHHIQGLKRILKSTFKKTSALTAEDKEAVAKMRAREFVNHCRSHHIHLREIWMQFDKYQTGSIP